MDEEINLFSVLGWLGYRAEGNRLTLRIGRTLGDPVQIMRVFQHSETLAVQMCYRFRLTRNGRIEVRRVLSQTMSPEPFAEGHGPPPSIGRIFDDDRRLDDGMFRIGDNLLVDCVGEPAEQETGERAVLDRENVVFDDRHDRLPEPGWQDPRGQSEQE